MEAKRLDTVTVKTTHDTVAIPWASREELLARLRRRLDPIALGAVRYLSKGADATAILDAIEEAAALTKPHALPTPTAAAS